jgi:uncharacterized protein
MEIIVSRISEEDGLNLHHTYPHGMIKLSGDGGEIAGPTTLTALATRIESSVRVVGNISSSIRIECSRCLEEMILSVEEPIDVLYRPPIDSPEPDEESELGEDDLEVSFYRGETINLEDMVREQIELALPMSRLCREDCRGLCPHCGTNLNNADCSCPKTESESRWAALKDIKLDS